MSTASVRFGVWAPVHGPRAAHQDPEEPYDASWERNRALVLQAEALGYDSTLIAQHTINPHQEDLDQLETWSAAAALAALTSRIEIIAAIKPYLFHPVVLAKMALQIENISHGRFALNLVNAWNRPELEKAGIGFAEHDDRYAYGREWISIVARLTAGERLTHKGENFDIRDYALRPKDLYRARPAIYVGGESDPARDLVAAHGDVWFINGQLLADVVSLIADVAARPRSGVPLRFGLSAFVIARETDAEAEQAHQHLLALAALDAPIKAIQRANTDPKVVMMQTMQKSPRGSGNFTPPASSCSCCNSSRLNPRCSVLPKRFFRALRKQGPSAERIRVEAMPEPRERLRPETMSFHDVAACFVENSPMMLFRARRRFGSIPSSGKTSSATR